MLRIWHSLVDSLWHQPPSSDSSEANSSPGIMTQLDNILDEVGLPAPAGEGATEPVSHEQALYGEGSASPDLEGGPESGVFTPGTLQGSVQSLPLACTPVLPAHGGVPGRLACIPEQMGRRGLPSLRCPAWGLFWGVGGRRNPGAGLRTPAAVAATRSPSTLCMPVAAAHTQAALNSQGPVIPPPTGRQGHPCCPAHPSFSSTLPSPKPLVSGVQRSTRRACRRRPRPRPRSAGCW